MTHRRVDGLKDALDAILDAGEARYDERDPWSLALAGFAASFRLDHDRARMLSERAFAAGPDDPEATVLAGALRGLVVASEIEAGSWGEGASGLTPTGDPIMDAIAALPHLAADPVGAFSGYALGEAALACGRVGLAARITAAEAQRRGGSPAVGLLADHPYASVMTVLVARVACFAGRVDDARRILGELTPTGRPDVDLLASATRALADGNAAEPVVVRGIAAKVEATTETNRDRFGAGTALLAAYGLVAIGDTSRAARLARTIDRSRAMTIDRALVLELLVADAVVTNDLGAARTWLDDAEQLAASPIADSTVERIRSRVALLSGDPLLALQAAERSVARATAEGRAIEAAEGEVLAARARISSGLRGDAARRLESVAEKADSAGHRAVRRAAGRELRGTGRRLRPPPGSGIDGMSPREREVVALLHRGWSSARIAAALHISPHTLRVHIARIRVAFDAPTLLALSSRWAAEAATDPLRAEAAREAFDLLTPRQRDVVAEVCVGTSTPDIGVRLGISTRTVEKHLTGAMRRWRVSSRAGLIARASGSTEVDPEYAE